MSETTLLLLIIARCILRIMDQHICSFNEAQKRIIAPITPFEIGGVHQAVLTVLDPVDNRTIQRMAITELGKYAHLARVRLIFLSFVMAVQYWLRASLLPGDALLIYHSMKCAMRWERSEEHTSELQSHSFI